MNSSPECSIINLASVSKCARLSLRWISNSSETALTVSPFLLLTSPVAERLAHLPSSLVRGRGWRQKRRSATPTHPTRCYVSTAVAAGVFVLSASGHRSALVGSGVSFPVTRSIAMAYTQRSLSPLHFAKVGGDNGARECSRAPWARRVLAYAMLSDGAPWQRLAPGRWIIWLASFLPHCLISSSGTLD
jgi:hypothetical protein